MNREHILEDIKAEISQMEYPESFLQQFEILECLACHDGTETFLAQHKGTKDQVIAKCYRDETHERMAGRELLKNLKHPQLPVYFGEYGSEKMTIQVRSYISGIPLDEYVYAQQLTREEIVKIGAALCDVLEYLHHQNPPVIHRDLKPSNVIVKRDGTPILIDFDTARTYKKNAEQENDTTFFGTCVYAPPEQYGFQQTDVRADIYSFGILMRFLLTGSARQNPNIRFYAPLEKIIQKCTRFSPDKRYKDISQVRKALLSANPRSRMIRHLKMTGCAVFAAVLCVLAGKQIYDYVTFDPFKEGHIPSVMLDEDRIADAQQYLYDKFGTNLLNQKDDYATFGLMRQILVELYGMDRDYVYAMAEIDPPEESPDCFFPWPLGNEQNIDQYIMAYYVVKIYWPDKVTDWSILKDDNGEYPGSRVAKLWVDKNEIFTGVKRPNDNTVGELAIALANADRICSALNEQS